MTGLVVVCRKREYEEMAPVIKLRLNAAINLLPLRPEQIEQYLAPGSKSWAGLRALLTDVTQRGKVQSTRSDCALAVKMCDGERKNPVRPVKLSTWALPRHPSLAHLRCVAAPLRETFFCLSCNAACYSMGEDFLSHATAQRRNVKSIRIYKARSKLKLAIPFQSSLDAGCIRSILVPTV